ncbi:ATP-binding protein [Frondihabitans sp. 4ASC-45]|uniref:nSTAND1 domain-containing NTPase n=1 Tax=Frondihabitans sp. 4ASC-45 TaxID=3111636 RepID=UPI003C1A3CDC
MDEVRQVRTDSPVKSYASGGVADKVGNMYELSWAVHYALLCLQDDRRSLTLEDLDPDRSNGSEFTYIDENGKMAVTQVKRQNSVNDHWTIAALRGRGVLDAASRHVKAGREYHFSSTTPCGQLRVLSELIRQSTSLEQFTSLQLTRTLAPFFDELAAPKNFGSAENAWRVLRGMWFEVESEQLLARSNASLADTLLVGADEALVVTGIGAVLLQKLRLKLTSRELLDGLAHYGISMRGALAKRTAHEDVYNATATWRGSVEREQLQPAIPRSESNDLINLMGTTRLALLVGQGGGGKSSVLLEVVTHLESQDAEVLAFRLDRFDAFNSTADLGLQLGLNASPVPSLRMAADGREAFLIVDQLDAVSLASGRLAERFDVIADLIQEAMATDGVRVILACRQFDVDNDHRIRKLNARIDVERLAVEPLSDEAVTQAVEAMGLEPKELSPTQRELLRSPLNLVLLESVSAQREALKFNSRGSLFEAFWQRKLQTIKSYRPGIRFNDVLARIANAASDQQTLSVAIETLDVDDFIIDAGVLASEQVLAIEGNRVSFFHETFFDYTFARQWMSRQQTMVEFLTAQEQDLFRRAQVRQILELLCERDPVRYRMEVEAVLTSSAIRYHLKETALLVFANMEEPTAEDLDLVLRISETDSSITSNLWRQVARASWFGAFHERGLVSEWLDSDDQPLRERGGSWLAHAGPQHGPQVAALLKMRRDAPEYGLWLRAIIQRADLHLNRPVFDVLLEAIRIGDIDPNEQMFWLVGHDLGKRQPLWAIELLKVCFVDRPSALVKGPDDKIAVLATHDYSLSKLIEDSSQAEPQAFVEAVIPFLLAVMRETAFGRSPDGLPIPDRHFSFRHRALSGADNADDSLYNRASEALVVLASADPDSAEPLLQLLATDAHESAQGLLFRTLTAATPQYVDWSARLILEGGNRLHCGDYSDSHYLSRQLVEAIAPFLSDEVHEQLEDVVRDLRNPYEHGRSFGYTAFKFISALDQDRLSQTGQRRLAEYRRKFNIEMPPQPEGVVGFVVDSPIDAAATGKMSNKQWLRAMKKHDNDDRNDDWAVGGARELSDMLMQRTAQDPARFARLAMELTQATNPAYPSAILRGFGEATIPSSALLDFFDAIRHITSLRQPGCDRWLGWSVRHVLEDTPIDLVELIRDRALSALDPSDDIPASETQNGDRAARDLRQHGVNSARGSLAETLGDLLVSDTGGERTPAVVPYLDALASDRDLGVRACTAHVIAASLRHERSTAIEAFRRLIDADDILLASDLVGNLMLYIGNVNPEEIDPIIERMLASKAGEVRQAGGRLAAFAALEWERPWLMRTALTGDVEIRVGVAFVCSARVDRAANSELAFSALRRLMQDENDRVRKEVGSLVHYLRDRSLRPFTPLLGDLIASPSYVHVTPQLLILLQEAPDRVDDLVDLAAHRFLDLFGDEVSDIRTGAAGDAHYIAELLVRGLAQTREKNRVAALLDILDRLLELGVYGVDSAIDKLERR